jgi:hypothetical protein
MLSVRENYCPDQVTFSGAEPSHPTTIFGNRGGGLEQEEEQREDNLLLPFYWLLVECWYFLAKFIYICLIV